MKIHSSWNTCVPLRKDVWPAGMCLLWEGPLLIHGTSAKGRRCLKFIILRNVSPYLGCLLHNTKQKISPLSRWCVPCTSQAVAFPWNRYFHGMSMLQQSRVRAVVSVPQVCSICFPVFPQAGEKRQVCAWILSPSGSSMWPWPELTSGPGLQISLRVALKSPNLMLHSLWQDFIVFLLSAATQVATA